MQSIVALCLLSSLASAQWSASQSSQSQHNSQYPRIKIGGPLGQLIPNGIQLGSGLGSLMNQLIGQAESQQQQQQQQQQQSQTQPSSPFAALRPPFQQQSSAANGFQSPLSFSPSKGFSFNSQLIPQNFYADSGLFGSASSPLGMASGPFTGHSQQLGSTNSELFSHSSSQLFD